MSGFVFFCAFVRNDPNNRVVRIWYQVVYKATLLMIPYRTDTYLYRIWRLILFGRVATIGLEPVL